MDEQIAANRARWDDMVAVNAASDYYDVEGFKAGETSLDPIALEQLGDVDGLSVLHLLCHIGLDTLSLARMGARAVGTDFSQPAIDYARSLAAELDLDARFVCCDLYDLPEHLEGRFDVILMSYGVIGWLRDLPRWAQISADFLAAGGRLHVIEFHPFAEMLDDAAPTLTPHFPYFRATDAVRNDRDGSYAQPDAKLAHVTAYSWPAGIADVLSAVLGAGLRIEGFREYPTCNEQLRPAFVRGADGLWRTPPDVPDLPITYALRASKPG